MMSEKKAADAAQRRSLMMLDDTLEESERISQLLDEVKQLTKTLEEERLNHKREVRYWSMSPLAVSPHPTPKYAKRQMITI